MFSIVVSDTKYDGVPSSSHLSIRPHEKNYPSEPNFVPEPRHNTFTYKTNDPINNIKNKPVVGTKPSGQRRRISNNECLVTNQAQNLVVSKKCILKNKTCQLKICF